MTIDQTLTDYIQAVGNSAKSAALQVASLTAEEKKHILLTIASYLRANTAQILAANQLDCVAASKKGLTKAMIARLQLDESAVENIAKGVEKVASLPDVIGEKMAQWQHAKGMQIVKQRVPIGVIGIIYESRPNVTVDAAVLCLHAGNTVILRGGSEAYHSNQILAKVMLAAGEQSGLPLGAIQVIDKTDRATVGMLCAMHDAIDLLIPRGGKGLIEYVVEHATMAVIKHYDGICHTYIDAAAKLEQAIELVIDAKTQKPSVCNALETLLVHRDIAPRILPLLAHRLDAKSVALRGDETVMQILQDELLAKPVEPATLADWQAEYLDYILAIKVVDSVADAVTHINQYGSKHSDCIITEEKASSNYFMQYVDSACVFHNVSTRFSDGEEFGFGAEIGISTDKVHARGPMGLKELTSYKYLIEGNGQTKE